MTNSDQPISMRRLRRTVPSTHFYPTVQISSLSFLAHRMGQVDCIGVRGKKNIPNTWGAIRLFSDLKTVGRWSILPRGDTFRSKGKQVSVSAF